MADFEAARANTARNEGGYTEDPHPTAFGIDRKFWPRWLGWLVVDMIKADLMRSGEFCNKAMTRRLRANPAFMASVESFFRSNFWLPAYNRLESQAVANIIYDRGVNMGIDQAVKILQRVLGIHDDGVFGKDTLFHANEAEPVQLCKDFDAACDDFYRSLNNPKYEKTWVNRT